MKKLSIAISLAFLFLSSSNLKAETITKNPLKIGKEQIELNLAAFGKYLEIGNAHQVEGVYATEDRRYMIALVKNNEKTHDYIGVVVAADNPYWEKGEVKFNLAKQKDGSLKGYYYNQNGKAFPIEFKQGKGGLETDMMHKLSVSEVQMGNLANL